MKQLIRNIQDWLLEGGKCSGCGKALAEGVVGSSGERMYIVCACSRLYVYDQSLKVFQRCESECNISSQKGEYA